MVVGIVALVAFIILTVILGKRLASRRNDN